MRKVNMNGIEVRIDELAAQIIKEGSKREAESIIANRISEKYFKTYCTIDELASSISKEKIKEMVLDRIADKIVDDWARRQYD